MATYNNWVFLPHARHGSATTIATRTNLANQDSETPGTGQPAGFHPTIIYRTRDAPKPLASQRARPPAGQNSGFPWECKILPPLQKGTKSPHAERSTVGLGAPYVPAICDEFDWPETGGHPVFNRLPSTNHQPFKQ